MKRREKQQKRERSRKEKKKVRHPRRRTDASPSSLVGYQDGICSWRAADIPGRNFRSVTFNIHTPNSRSKNFLSSTQQPARERWRKKKKKKNPEGASSYGCERKFGHKKERGGIRVGDLCKKSDDSSYERTVEEEALGRNA
jgi:hypothetical protein